MTEGVWPKGVSNRDLSPNEINKMSRSLGTIRKVFVSGTGRTLLIGSWNINTDISAGGLTQGDMIVIEGYAQDAGGNHEVIAYSSMTDNSAINDNGPLQTMMVLGVGKNATFKFMIGPQGSGNGFYNVSSMWQDFVLSYMWQTYNTGTTNNWASYKTINMKGDWNGGTAGSVWVTATATIHKSGTLG
jgi:hypothetical protein